MRGPGSRSAARGGVPGLVPVTIGRSWFPLSRTFCDMFVPAGQPVVVVWGVERFDADQETQAWATAARIQRDHDRRDRPVAHLLVDRVVNGVNVQGLVRAIAGAGGLDERLDIDAVALHRELLAAKLVLGLRASRSADGWATARRRSRCGSSERRKLRSHASRSPRPGWTRSEAHCHATPTRAKASPRRSSNAILSWFRSSSARVSKHFSPAALPAARSLSADRTDMTSADLSALTAPEATVYAAVIAALTTLIVSTGIKFFLDDLLMRRKARTDYEYEQRKALRQVLGRYQGPLVDSAEACTTGCCGSTRTATRRCWTWRPLPRRRLLLPLDRVPVRRVLPAGGGSRARGAVSGPADRRGARAASPCATRRRCAGR